MHQLICPCLDKFLLVDQPIGVNVAGEVAEFLPAHMEHVHPVTLKLPNCFSIYQNTGISIQKATIKAANDLAPVVATVQTYLGRPWKEYSRTVYMHCFMDNVINPAGWHEWNGDFALNTSYYAEYNNMGPGSNTANRVTWSGYHVINANEAANFTVSSFLDGGGLAASN